MHIDISNTFLFTIILIKLTSIGFIFSKAIQEVNLTLGEHHKVVKSGNEVKAEIDMWIQVSTYSWTQRMYIQKTRTPTSCVSHVSTKLNGN